MGNLLKSLFENKGNVISEQVIESARQYGVDNTNLSRFFDALNQKDEITEDRSVEKLNVLIVQPTRNGHDDADIYTQFNRLSEDLYNNTQWDILLCKNVEDAAQQLLRRASKVENLVYLHHGGQWGFMPVEVLDGKNAKELLDLRNNFLIDRIIKSSKNGEMSKEEAAKNLKTELLDKNYEQDFVKKQLEYTETPTWQGLVKVFFGIEKLLKNIKPNGTFIDASCNQGSNYSSDNKIHTSFDSLKSLSFEKINIYVNTNATIVGKNSTIKATSLSLKNETVIADIGTITNFGMTSGFRDNRGWIKYDSLSQKDIVTGKDLILYSYKKPVFELLTWVNEDNPERIALQKNRTMWFSKKFRKWRRDDIEAWFTKTYSKPTKENLDKWFDYYFTNPVKKDAKL